MRWALLILFFQVTASAHDFSGSISFEPQFFYDEGLFGEQERVNLSGTVKPKYSHDWESGRQVIDVEGFFRLDQYDSNRTHFDIREMAYTKAWDEIELSVGIKKVFWGVTESQHLVDVINQTDFVEGLDGEEKLGQPMVTLSWARDVGTFDFYLLPVFRERNFRSNGKNRLRFAQAVDTSLSTFESSAEENHVDYALRWSHSLGQWEVALSYFSGTSREPTLNSGTDSNGQSVFVPHYYQVSQTGVELQQTIESWLIKFEGIFRRTESVTTDASAFVGGFEYTFYGLIGQGDLGILTEYHYDDRGALAFSGLQNDLFLGARWALNDEDSTEFLGGFIFDLEDSPKLFFVEGSSRFGENWKLSLEVRGFIDIPTDDFFATVRRDGYIQTDIEYFF